MPFTDSYLWSNIADLTQEFSGFIDTQHYVDSSEGDIDIQGFIGSALESPEVRSLVSATNPGSDPITITPTDNLAEWQTAHAYTIGQCVQPTTPNGKRYKCTTSGTSHASTEPTWPTTGIGATVTDGTAVWEYTGAKHEITEVFLALTQIGLDSASGGAALSLATTIDNGVANAIEFWIRIRNNVGNVSNNTGSPEIIFILNSVTENGAA